MGKTLVELAEAIEKGIIVPEDFSVGGDLPHTQSQKLLDLVVSQNDFLKEVHYEPMDSLKHDLNVLDVAQRILVRVPEGTEPTDAQKKGVIFAPKTLHALDVELFYSLGFSTILANKKRFPNFEDRLTQMFAKRFGNDLVDLGFNGTADDNSAGFLTLNKGWVTLAEESSDTSKVDFGSGGVNADTWRKKFDAVIAAMPDRFKPGAWIIMSSGDYEDYLTEVGNVQGGLSILLTGKGADTYKGYKIRAVPYMPSGKIIFTNPQNLVFGAVTRVQRYREVKATKRSVDYTFVMWVDYEIAVDEALVLGRTVS